MKEGKIMSIKDALIMIRAELNLSQTELAEKLNVSYASISRWEAGKVKPTKKALYNINKLCRENNIEIKVEE